MFFKSVRHASMFDFHSFRPTCMVHLQIVGKTFRNAASNSSHLMINAVELRSAIRRQVKYHIMLFLRSND